MEHRQSGVGRRDFLKAAGLGALGTVVTGGVLGGALGRGLAPASADTVALSLVASDGYVSVPGREGNPLYIFGFVNVTSEPDQSISHLVSKFKGHTQTS